MKAHIGTDVESGLVVHTVVTTPANASDVSVVQDLLHGEEASLHGDAGSQLGPERTQALAEPIIAATGGTVKKGSPLPAGRRSSRSTRRGNTTAFEQIVSGHQIDAGLECHIGCAFPFGSWR